MTLTFLKKKPSFKATEKLELITALRQVDGNAIRTVANKITPDVRAVIRKCNLPLEDLPEVVHDSIMVLISAIQEGKYEEQGYHPAAYAFGVARKLIANRARAKKAANLELDKVQLVSDFDTEVYLENKERRIIVEKLLQRLGDTCRELIRFKFFDHLKDKEIVERGLLNFSSTDSVKSKRSQCMKKLGIKAKEAGIRAMF